MCIGDQGKVLDTFKILQDTRPYVLQRQGVPADKILPGDGMVVLENNITGKAIRVTINTANTLMDWQPNNWKLPK